MYVQNSKYIPEPEWEQFLSSLPLQKKNQVIKWTFENAKKSARTIQETYKLLNYLITFLQ